MDGAIVRVLDMIDTLVAPIGVAAYTAGALVQFVPRSRAREKIAFIVHVGQLVAILLWLIFWNRHFLPYSEIEVNILVNVLGIAFIATSLWNLSRVCRGLQRKGINDDRMDP